MKQGILFDLDGTLWDATAEVTEAWNRCLREHAPHCGQLTVGDMRRFMGKTLDEIAAMMLPDLPGAEQLRIAGLCIDAEQAYLGHHRPRLYPHEREILTELAQRYTLGVVSNCQDGYVQLYLEQCGFAGLFSDFECAGRTGKSKGENLRLVVQRLGLTGCLYVGDTQGDCDAARLAGVPFVHAAYGFGTADQSAAALHALDDLPAVAARLLR